MTWDISIWERTLRPSTIPSDRTPSQPQGRRSMKAPGETERAMLESNSPRDKPPRLIADDEQGRCGALVYPTPTPHTRTHRTDSSPTPSKTQSRLSRRILSGDAPRVL